MPALPRLAYLTALYPAASHTFILREVSALRGLGFEVETCSMRRPAPAHLIGPEEEAALASTFYIIASCRNPLVMLRALWDGLKSPRRLLATLALAWRTAPPGAEGLMKQGFYLAEALVLARHLRARGVDHLHNHFAEAGANVAMLTSALSGIPFSYTLHGPSDLYEPHKWQLREKMARAAFVACISHFARSQAMYFSDPVHWHKLRIVHCGVIPERYESPAPVPGNGMRLIFVGRLVPVKGLRVLMDAFARARGTRPGLNLTLVGDGDDRALLERHAAPMGDAVTFTGYLSQAAVAEALAEADAMVLPSFAEGVPVVLMEAMAAGKPVIATQVGGVGELVEDGVSGFLIPPGDADALVDRILRIADDPELRSRMGAAGQVRVRTEFDVRTEAARVGALFAGQGGTAPRPDPLEAA